MGERDLGAVAREIIDANQYMVLGTADGTGRPWVSPVWYAFEGYREFYWVSSPEARHSRNIAARPDVSIVVFNSQVPIGTGQGVYMEAVAKEVESSELDRGMDVFSRRSLAQGGRRWTREDVDPPGAYRLFRAVASDHWILAPDAHPDRRTRVTP